MTQKKEEPKPTQTSQEKKKPDIQNPPDNIHESIMKKLDLSDGKLQLCALSMTASDYSDDRSQAVRPSMRDISQDLDETKKRNP
jgi:hypothetical protein